ncbi:heme-transporting ATPase [Aureococcus anophagefferens]|nr:heme-transporting ATPase [Aureococcus anophagefferens]
MERRRRLLLALVAVANAIEAPRSVAGAAQLRGARDVPGATTESETDYAAAAETDGAAAGRARGRAAGAARDARRAVPAGVGAAVFGKAHAMDARWHANHPTGEVAVAFGRGTRGCELAVPRRLFRRAAVLELVFSVGVLRRRFGSHGFGLSVAANVNEALEQDRFDEVLAASEREAVASQALGGALNLGQAAIFAVGLHYALRLALRRFDAAASFSVGDVVAVNALLLQLAQPMNFLGYTVSEIRQGLVGGRHRLSGVSASRDGFTLALKNATFTARRRRHALVVASGSGKSTALRLVNGLDAAPTAGAVTVGGIALSAADARRDGARRPGHGALRRHGALQREIRQRARAAGGGRRRAGRRGRRAPRPAAARRRGAKLSGEAAGPARARSSRAPVLLADEPTSALDAVSEARVLDALLGSGRTAVVVAHRLAAVAPRADNIAVFRDGTVVAEGKHDALLASCAEYARLWEAKSGSSEEGE